MGRKFYSLHELLFIDDILKEITRSESSKCSISFERFLSERFTGRPDYNVRFHSVEKFPIEICLKFARGNYIKKNTSVLVGHIVQEFETEYDETEYATYESRRAKIEDENGLVVITFTDSWNGIRNLEIFYSLEETVTALKKIWKQYKANRIHNALNGIFKFPEDYQDIKNFFSTILSEINRIVIHNECTIVDDNTKDTSVVAFKNDQRLFEIYISETYSSGDYYYLASMISSDDDLISKYSYKYECDWVQMGWSGPSKLRCTEESVVIEAWKFKLLKQLARNLNTKFKQTDYKSFETNKGYGSKSIYIKSA